MDVFMLKTLRFSRFDSGWMDGRLPEYKVECVKRWRVNNREDGRGSQAVLSTPSSAVQGRLAIANRNAAVRSSPTCFRSTAEGFCSPGRLASPLLI